MAIGPFDIPSYDFPQIQIPEFKSVQEYAFEAIKSSIRNFEQKLPHNSEAAIQVGSATGIIQAAHMTLLDAGLIEINGINGHGQNVNVICHYTQLSIQLIEMTAPDEKPRRIGF